MSYFGGKNGDGVYQKIINRIPQHKVYLEPFLGGGAIMKRKRPADINIGMDRDEEALSGFPIKMLIIEKIINISNIINEQHQVSMMYIWTPKFDSSLVLSVFS